MSLLGADPHDDEDERTLIVDEIYRARQKSLNFF
jgi:hypothetical protein